MGGDVDVRTRAGVGTVFAFKIPHAESEPARSGVCEAAA
jgi:signal transduction histidine kinase